MSTLESVDVVVSVSTLDHFDTSEEIGSSLAEMPIVQRVVPSLPPTDQELSLIRERTA